MNEPLEVKRFTPASIGFWLNQGWSDFTKSSFVSIAYAAIFCIFGGVALVWLLHMNMGIFFFYLAGGFMLVAPILVTGYYKISRMLRAGQEPVFDDIVALHLGNRRAMLTMGLLVALVFLIWMVDAIVIHSVFFSNEPMVMREFANNPGVRGNSAAFIVIGSILGSILAFIIYTLTVFSIPHIFHRKADLGEAIVLSIKAVFYNLDVMLLWAAVMTLLTFGTLLVALPLIIVAFPILGYASYAAYLDLLDVPGAQP